MRFFSTLLCALSLSVSSVYSQVCTITVPQFPLTPVGLATPYTQVGCNQGGGTATFVQAVIINLDTGALSAYSPLIIDAGTMPAITPQAPILPVRSVVGLWFGTNGGATQLVTSSTTVGMDSLQQGVCVNGGGEQYTIFGQFAACNARAFFNAARELQVQGLLKMPQLGIAFDGNPCPTTHDFGIVDQDQSDNVNTKYLVTATGQAAQWTPANVLALPGATVISNGSDEVLITKVAAAINCTVWMIPDLTDTTGKQLVATLPTNEMFASQTVPPVAFVPVNHAMTLNNGVPDLLKTNAYRVNVGQWPITSLAQGALKPYCDNLYSVGAVRLANWFPKTLNAPSVDLVNPNLATFLVNRFLATTGPMNFNCTQFYPGLQPPFKGIVDANGNIQLLQRAGQTTAQLIGANVYTANNINNLQDPLNFMVNFTQNAQVLVPGGPSAAAGAGTAGAGAGAGTTTTTTTAASFSGMWLGIGIAIGAVVILTLDLCFLLFKRSKA